MAISTAILPGSIASGVGIEFQNVAFRTNVDRFSQVIGVVAQPSEGASGFSFNTGVYINSAQAAGALFGFGSPIHSICRILFNPRQSVGQIPVLVWPIDKAVGATESTGDIQFAGTQTITKNYELIIASQRIDFTLTAGMTATEAADLVKNLIDSNINLPVNTDTIIADDLPLISKWNGATANDIRITLNGTEAGITIVITQMSGGTLTPDITDALDNFGEVWQTLIINQFYDSGNLTALNTRGEELWQATIAKPFVSFYGSVETDPSIVSSDTNNRKDERVNSKFPVPGSNSLEFELAASACAYIAIVANENPPKPYFDAKLFGIIPGAFSDQWSYDERDYIEKRGCSTSYVDAGLVKIGDMLTTYHPLGDDNPGYRYVVDVVKTQLIIFDIRSEFSGINWQGTILVDDDDNTINPAARKPSSALAAMYGLIDTWADSAVILNRDFCKQNSTAERDGTNPNRINMVFSLNYSGAGRIRSATVKFSTEVGV